MDPTTPETSGPEGVAPSSGVESAITDVRALGLEFARSLAGMHLYAQRCPGLIETHLFFKVLDLLMHSGLAASFLIAEGMRNPAGRELRFLLEASIKLLFADQKMPRSSLADRLTFYERKVAESGFDKELKAVELSLMSPDAAVELKHRIPRLYGELSSFVHPTHRQVISHIGEQAAGLVIGDDTQDTINAAAAQLFETVEVSVVMCLHSIGPRLAGDMMLAYQDMPWVFHAGRFIADLDATYDYKVERQSCLTALVERRRERREAGWRAQCSSNRN